MKDKMLSQLSPLPSLAYSLRGSACALRVAEGVYQFEKVTTPQTRKANAPLLWRTLEAKQGGEF